MKTPLCCALFGLLVMSSATAAPLALAGERGSMAEMHAPSQSGEQLPSPPADASVTLNGKAIAVHYNSPRMRGRKIMGELVPYGQVWRTGANPATSFVTEADLKVGDLSVPAGKYTLYTLPGAPGTPWLLILNKQTGQWGTVYNQDRDLGRMPMHAATLAAPQENMTISFEHTTGNTTELHVRWETTDEWVRIEAH